MNELNNTKRRSQAIAICEVIPEFKSAKLAEESKTIFVNVETLNNTALDTTKAIAVSLYHIERDKLYKEDGFKSLAEYAERMGMDKSLAHKMENAGRMLDSANETIRNFAALTDYSKLAMLASEDEADVADAINKMELTPDSTSANVRQWKANRKEAKAKVLSTYDIDLVVYHMKEKPTHHSYNGVLVDDVDEFQNVSWGKVKMANGTTVIVGINEDFGDVVRIVKQEKVKPPKKEKYRPGTRLEASAFSDDLLKAAMAEYIKRHGMPDEFQEVKSEKNPDAEEPVLKETGA